MKLTLYGDPRTKKNSARILKSRSGGRFVAPSKAYVDYETDCLRQIKRPRSPISAHVLEDDNSRIVAAHDGSRVELDREKPRVEIWIEEMEDENG
jgi:hypothetical protein